MYIQIMLYTASYTAFPPLPTQVVCINSLNAYLYVHKKISILVNSSASLFFPNDGLQHKLGVGFLVVCF